MILDTLVPEAWALLPDRFTVYLARHASPDRSRTDIPYHVVPGPPLLERGLTEAAELGVFFQRAGVVHVSVSPLVRTLHTAKIATTALGLTPEISEDLHEWRLEEPENAVFERLSRAFHNAARLSEARGPVALVTHGGPIHLMLKAFGLPNEWIDRHRIYDGRNPIPPAGAWRVARSNGEMSVDLVFTPQGYRLPETEKI